MSTIRAIVVDPMATARLAVATVEAPTPLPGEVLVRVAAISLNRGEVRGAQAASPGARPGWDLAGTVEQAAVDGSGPKAGQRVVGVLRTRAWAELAAVPTTALAVLPDAVSFSQAATLPVAGLTALYALDKGDGLLGRNVLVTGASGGVGHLGVQLAIRGGARVIGLVHQDRHAAMVRAAGAHAVVADETGAAAKDHGPYHLILESVGGAVLGNVLGMLALDGVCVSYGVSAGGAATIDAALLFRNRGTLVGMQVFQEMSRETAAVGLARLVQQVTAGKLVPHIDVEAPWTEIGAIAQQLIDRRYPGKAVLLVS